jgi:hypothetical protein
MSGRGKGKSIVENTEKSFLLFIKVEKVSAKVVPNDIVKYFEIISKVSLRLNEPFD